MRPSAFVWLLLATSLAGCQGGSEPPQAGSESHFLVTCNATCAGGFECLCGVCTEVCSSDATCSAITESATCVTVATRPQTSRCEDAQVAAFCDVTCNVDADCDVLGGGFACSGGFCRQGAAATASEPIQLDAVCDMYVSDVCRAKIDCFEWDYASYEACQEAQECDGFARLNELLGRGSVHYDAAATGDCHARLQKNACSLGPILFGVPDLPEALRMCGALSGQLGEGAACDSSVECAKGLSCDTRATCPGQCVAPEDDLPEGAACVTEICIPAQEHCSQCALGLDCIGQVCVKTPAVGDPCSGVLSCGNALWCDSSRGSCAPKAAVGEACSNFRQIAPDCSDGLWCDDPPAIPMQSGICHEPSQSGQACRSDGDCVKPLSCVPGSAPSALGVCADKQANGAACDSFADCDSNCCDKNLCAAQPTLGETCIDTCAEGLTCSAGVCATKRYAGEPCGDGTSCINSRCVAGTCTNRGHFGDVCATADDCLSKHCAGTCVDPTGCEG